MTHASAAGIACDRWSRLWRMAVIALCTLILCSCRGPIPGIPGSSAIDDAAKDPPAHGEMAMVVRGQNGVAGGFGRGEAPPPPSAVLSAPSSSAPPGYPAVYPVPPAAGALKTPPPTPYSPAVIGGYPQLPLPPASARDNTRQPHVPAPPPGYGQIPCPPGYGSFAPGMVQGLPLPQSVISGAWTPPGMARHEPANEYLRDGGDGAIPSRVTRGGEVRGLELEDTIVHFDTPDGRTLVEPSNQVHIYSPRFAAVRQVVSLVAGEQMHRAAGVHQPQKLVGPTTVQPVTSSKQHLQPVGQVGARPPVIFRGRQAGGVVSTAIGPRGFQDAFKPYENISVIRFGVMETAELAWLARGTTAAMAWTHKQAVQIILDRQAAAAEVSDRKLQMVYTVQQPPANPRLRVIKVASEAFAQPGEVVDFTIRFDNIGNQTIGNVTILDNLTTRLEFVPDSAQCSLPAQFSTQPNEGDSLVLRCELNDPLAPGKGGVLRFRCRVR